MADLTPKERKLVTTTWAAVMQGKTKHGIVLFQNIFEIAPPARALFKFGKANDLQASELARLHADGVMDTVDFAVQRLDNLGEVVPALQKLGAMHAKYKVLPAHFPIVGQALLKTLGDGLGEHWTSEVEVAWLKSLDHRRRRDETEIGEGYEKSKKKKALKVGKKGTEGQNPSQNGCGTTAMAMSAVLAVAGFALYAAQDF
eukprot:CAMPEP_0170176996 /NCGR_PEP_ID=MMETSP0040_2-20121228/9734_1 /TAXON_ID=641309 /ORGANISM="Lotharella oceanica, Strain CCMP622" /LENGTH=200 /DNA_ID=CAMNT_0010419477 /DNA_START=148 /DNA_END=751 /DNA_ORIENTATION=-